MNIRNEPISNLGLNLQGSTAASSDLNVFGLKKKLALEPRSPNLRLTKIPVRIYAYHDVYSFREIITEK